MPTCLPKMSFLQYMLSILLMLKASLALGATINQGFGYEILVTKIETLEDRFVKLDCTIQNSTASIMSELNSLRELIKSQKTAQQKVYDACDKVSSKVSGVYIVQLNPQETARVYCDQMYDGGGWTVIQWRFDGSTNFYREWAEYKQGFGNMNGGEFWLGLDVIHKLTYSGSHEMVILLEDFEGNSTHAKLDRFEMAGEQEIYKVTMADGYSGTAGDSISGIKNNNFSTFDKDSDTYPGNCASDYHGAWWYSKCHSSNLNGKYSKGITTEYATGMVWNAFRGYHYALKSSKMMIRRKKAT